MEVLDIEIRRLIKMRYLLRKDHFILSKDMLEQAVVQLELDSQVLEKIAIDMSDFKDSSDVSRSSVGRWMGKYAAKSNISKSNLSCIAKYLLCNTWDELISLTPEDIEQRLLKEYGLVVAVAPTSMDSRVDDTSFGIHRIISHNVLSGKVIDVRYGHKNKLLRLKKLNSPDRYMVLESDSAILKKSWTISIPAILLGVNVVGIDIQDKKEDVKSIYKSSGPVNSIMIIDIL